jgi:hypothetical protein
MTLDVQIRLSALQYTQVTNTIYLALPGVQNVNLDADSLYY